MAPSQHDSGLQDFVQLLSRLLQNVVDKTIALDRANLYIHALIFGHLTLDQLAALDYPIERLELTNRSYRALKESPRAITTIRELVSCTEDQLHTFRNLGQLSVLNIVHKLQLHGLHLGMLPHNRAQLAARQLLHGSQPEQP